MRLNRFPCLDQVDRPAAYLSEGLVTNNMKRSLEIPRTRRRRGFDRAHGTILEPDDRGRRILGFQFVDHGPALGTNRLDRASEPTHGIDMMNGLLG